MRYTACMKFVSIRDLRNNPGFVRESAQEDDLVLTANGKPFAMIVSVEEDGLEDTSRAIKLAKAQVALARMRRQAERQGLRGMSLAAINVEIKKSRSARRRSART